MTKVETARTFKNMKDNLRSLCIYLSSKGYTPDLRILIKDVYFWQVGQAAKRNVIISWENGYVNNTTNED